MNVVYVTTWKDGVCVERDVAYKLKLITDKLKVRADEDLKTLGLTLAQSYVLTFLMENGGTAAQKEITTFLQVSHPTVVGIVSRMEQNGFLDTWFDPADQRSKMVRLTNKAHRTGHVLEQIKKEHQQILLKSFSPEEVLVFHRMLDRILDNIN